jgi:hypothetical protein
MDENAFQNRDIMYSALVALSSMLTFVSLASPLLALRPSDEATDDLGRVLDEWRERHHLTTGAVLVGTMLFLQFVIHAVLDRAHQPSEVMEGE